MRSVIWSVPNTHGWRTFNSLLEQTQNTPPDSWHLSYDYQGVVLFLIKHYGDWGFDYWWHWSGSCSEFNQLEYIVKESLAHRCDRNGVVIEGKHYNPLQVLHRFYRFMGDCGFTNWHDPSDWQIELWLYGFHDRYCVEEPNDFLKQWRGMRQIFQDERLKRSFTEEEFNEIFNDYSREIVFCRSFPSTQLTPSTTKKVKTQNRQFKRLRLYV